MKAVILVVLGLAALAAAKPALPVKHRQFPGLNPGRIVGGVPADPHEFPFITLMRRNGAHYCAGSIISDSWVLTAAHCAQGAASSYALVAGDHNIGNTDGREQSRQVVRIVNHPSYGSPSQFANDIALMLVESPYDFNEWVAPILMMPEGTEGTPVATVAGWGATSEGGSTSQILLKVDVPFVDDTTCRASYGNNIEDSMICYGEGGKDSCQGDSGGPVLCRVDGVGYLCGVVSWGQGCARPNYPGVYTEVSYYHGFVEGSTVEREEDESPAHESTECGGVIEGTSGRVTLTNVQDGQTCLWTAKVPLSRVRVQISAASGGTGSTLHMTQVGAGGLGNTVEIANIGEDVFSTGPMVLLSLQAGAGLNNFVVEWYGSGFGDLTNVRYTALGGATGSYNYPENGGNYQDNENSLFVLAANPGATITWTRFDTESSYDTVAVSQWTGSQWNQMGTYSGTSLPPNHSASSGQFALQFRSDSSITRSGFSFNWA